MKKRLLDAKTLKKCMDFNLRTLSFRFERVSGRNCT